MTTTTMQTNDTADNLALSRIRPWQPDPRWPIIRGTTPPLSMVSLALSGELLVLIAKARAEHRLSQAQVERQHAERINAARAIFNAGDSTKRELAQAVHEADAERIAREDRLAAAFDPYTYEAIMAGLRQDAQAANERSGRESMAEWQQHP